MAKLTGGGILGNKNVKVSLRPVHLREVRLLAQLPKQG
jgi:hypothetical protein